jgi:hypothetical protein
MLIIAVPEIFLTVETEDPTCLYERPFRPQTYLVYTAKHGLGRYPQTNEAS